MNDTDELDGRVRTAIYQAFIARGRAPVAAEVADLVDAVPADVEDAFERLHDAHLIVLAPGTPYIWMANPLSALPTPYTADCEQGTFWGNCIWDALGIVAMLGNEGVVRALCPDCGDDLSLEVRAGELAANDYRVHYTVPAAHWWDDIGFN